MYFIRVQFSNWYFCEDHLRSLICSRSLTTSLTWEVVVFLLGYASILNFGFFFSVATVY
jgi:hypothetical protein